MTMSEIQWEIRKRRENEFLGAQKPPMMDVINSRLSGILDAGSPANFARRLQFPEIIELEKLWEESPASRGELLDYFVFDFLDYTVFSDNIPLNVKEIMARNINRSIAQLRDEKAAQAASDGRLTQQVIAELFDLLTEGLSEGTRDAQCRIALLTLLNPCEYKGVSLQSELQPDACFYDEEARDEVLSKWDLKRKNQQAQEIKRLLPTIEKMYHSVTFNIQPVNDFISNNQP